MWLWIGIVEYLLGYWIVNYLFGYYWNWNSFGIYELWIFQVLWMWSSNSLFESRIRKLSNKFSILSFDSQILELPLNQKSESQILELSNHDLTNL